MHGVLATEDREMLNYLEPGNDFAGKGIYILLIKLRADREITIGRLGLFHFKRGIYAYVGSALGGFKSRIRRHLKKNKKLQWHIDYLLEFADISDVLTIETNKRLECAVARALGEHFEAVLGFGSSDCKCKSHLFFSPNARELQLRAMEILNLLGYNTKKFQIPRTKFQIFSNGED